MRIYSELKDDGLMIGIKIIRTVQLIGGLFNDIF